MNRRCFFRTGAAARLAASSGLGPALRNLYAFGQNPNLSHVEARYYKRLPDREVECELCPRKCRLGDRERGYCGVRQNDGGTYYSLVYGKACSINVDPIEKKPFFHLLPGTNAFSFATAGCNVNCKFCQNWEISQVRPEQVRHVDLPPETAVVTAEAHGCRSIAYTYSEPTVFYEYMFDTAVLARRSRIKNAVVSGGHINPEPLAALTKVVDAIKIDLKAFNPDSTDLCRGTSARPRSDQAHLEEPGLARGRLSRDSRTDDGRPRSEDGRVARPEAGPDVLPFYPLPPHYHQDRLNPRFDRKRSAAALEEGFSRLSENIRGTKARTRSAPNARMLIRRNGFEIVETPSSRERVRARPDPGVWAWSQPRPSGSARRRRASRSSFSASSGPGSRQRALWLVLAASPVGPEGLENIRPIASAPFPADRLASEPSFSVVRWILGLLPGETIRRGGSLLRLSALHSSSMILSAVSLSRPRRRIRRARVAPESPSRVCGVAFRLVWSKVPLSNWRAAGVGSRRPISRSFGTGRRRGSRSPRRAV
jgi:pyruvate formate lyase activating enzyme